MAIQKHWALRLVKLIRQTIEFVRTARLVSKDISEKSEEIQRVRYCGIFQPWSTVWGRYTLLSNHLFWSTAWLFRWVVQLLEHWHWSETHWSHQVWQFSFRHARKFVFEDCYYCYIGIIVSAKCSRHNSRNINTNRIFIVLTLNHCLQCILMFFN